ncbi:glycoside hydrolase family 19 protein [Mariniflexile sp. HMF6888]|uniref:glycoside hydrolase family 19 protein n=1 Tax=Mariniflexile sp. HMF6888 TaxID=3373086 RepID=UPI003790BAFD
MGVVLFDIGNQIQTLDITASLQQSLAAQAALEQARQAKAQAEQALEQAQQELLTAMEIAAATGNNVQLTQTNLAQAAATGYISTATTNIQQANQLLGNSTQGTGTTTLTWYYLDLDGDGYHRAAQQRSTHPGIGWSSSTNGLDCDDDDPRWGYDCNPVRGWFLDNDSDGYHAIVQMSSTMPTAPGRWTDVITKGPDCDDNDANRKTAEDCELCKTSKEDLKTLFPAASDTNLETLSNTINKYAKSLGVDTKIKLQHLLSQTGHETGGYGTLQVTESTYWTTASKLAETYTKFTTDSTAASKDVNLYYANDYLKNSKGVANIAMCCNYHNGDVASGDGYKYRGRGIMQLTWKANYEDFQTWYNANNDPDIDVVTNPDLLSTDNNLAILSGLWYFKTRVLDKYKDFDKEATVDNVTIKINGKKKKGLADRKARFNKAKENINCQ